MEEINLSTKIAKENFLAKHSFENFAVYAATFIEPAENEYIACAWFLDKLDCFAAKFKIMEPPQPVETVRVLHN